MTDLEAFLNSVPDEVWEYARTHDGKIAWLGVACRLPYQLLLQAERLGLDETIRAILARAQERRG